MMQYTIQSLMDYVSMFIYPKEIAAGKKLLLKSAAYPINGVTLAAGATTQSQLQIQANADFLCTRLAHRACVAAAAQTVSSKIAPLWRVLITDSGSNEQWTNQAVDLETYSSNDAKIVPLDYPRFLSGRSQVTCTFTSYDAAAQDTIDFVLFGMNCFLL